MNERAALDRSPSETDRIGFFGKLPSHGDFVSMGLGRGLQTALDAWLQSGLQAAQQDLGEDWERRFRLMPAWRFIIERGLWGPATVAGVLLPSLDRVGRSFPLVIAAQLHGFSEHPRQLYLDDTWFTAAEAIAESSAKRDFEINHFTASLKRLRSLRPADLAENETLQDRASSRGTIWWRIDPEERRAKGFGVTGAPEPAHFAKLLRESASVVSTAPQPETVATPRPVVVEPHPPLVLRHSHATHAGTRLAVNADALLVSETPSLFAVADGVGDGNTAAEVGKIAVHVLAETAKQQTIEALVQEVKGKLGRAHGLLQSAYHSSDREPSAASIVVLATLGDSCALLWVGDARCYLLRDGMMRCLTRDHVEIGLRRTLSRAIGMRGHLIPEVRFGGLQAGDRLLLCSAPLPNAIPERGIAEILLSAKIEKAADILVHEGLIANCRDNLSAIVIDVKTDEP
ncbi:MULTISPECIES: type VI secretion system-associated protein TagF [Rhizobium]|uniref:type VI secretion system-associated protein TagF n=1 Tax=Rhizobium TaxID=379 RepID=UPI0007B511FE|nr:MULTISPECIES: type VI secretion system-associated protein TagF [Rhizobium]KZS55080.1 nitrogen fixation protein [Rhizobium anhuiense bv. trifolii]MBB3301613.1 type VI secretion system protein ImpM [Rhizobium sp. BK112]MBB3370917.1 type VI secretion system protein ImpM [Rhizobium sp. BK077]MBB3746879.1 type VI secretion system protein ImpM [Rhizobium sp. BK591]MBB4115395.1 type VI secretion system protein ImpM [Rhizobium sp. BK226]